jgi:hypothetical protein
MENDPDDHLDHEQKLAAALRNLVQQIDINDYRDSMGHDAKNNLAFVQAQQIADEFCVTHAEICAALGEHGYDVERLTAHFATRH